MERLLAKSAALLLLCSLVASATGCPGQVTTDGSTSGPIKTVARKNQQQPDASGQSTSGETSQSQAEDLHDDGLDVNVVQESWFALYMGEAKIGHLRNRTVSLERSGKTVIRTDSEQRFSIHRSGDRVDQMIRTQSLERPGGEVLELRTEVRGSGSPVITHAVRKGDRLNISFTAQDNTTETSIEWRREWRGFDAEQQLLRSKLPEPGEKLSFSSFLPVVNVVAQTQLTAKKWEHIETPYGRKNLLRIESRVATPQGTLEAVLWCDKKGEIQGFSQANMAAYRTTQELALAENDEFDLYAALNIKVEDPIPEPHRAQRAVYRARLQNGADPLHAFASDHSQKVTSIRENEVQIEVIAVRPDTAPLEGAAPSPPTEADLAANALIQTEDPRIRKLLSQIDGPADDPWQWALACEAFVSRTVDNQLTEAFLTAAEVAAAKTGDCTEHSVLTAALCRAHGLPTRVATGLVAYEDLYAFHMWNEVWIKDRWLPIDSTLGTGGIGAGHIKLGVSNLEGVSPFAALSPVLEVMGALELEVVSWE